MFEKAPLSSIIMLKEKYLEWLKKDLDVFFNRENVQVFLFGTSVKKDTFADIDIGISGEITDRELQKLREQFEESNFPYFIDVVNFNKVKDSFRKNVFNSELMWIKR